MLFGILFAPMITKAQEETESEAEATEEAAPVQAAPAPTPVMTDDDIVAEEQSFHQVIKDKFIEGDPTYMTPVLLCLILGLAVALERIITLNLSTTNTKKLLAKVESALEEGGIEAAKDVTKGTRGPVASLAPMLGFMGTVIGMIGAFDSIEAAGDISPSLVAGGIKIALLTTVAGLIVAIILQLFYNYCVAKIDSIVNDMEDASISLVDILVKHKLTR